MVPTARCCSFVGTACFVGDTVAVQDCFPSSFLGVRRAAVVTTAAFFLATIGGAVPARVALATIVTVFPALATIVTVFPPGGASATNVATVPIGGAIVLAIMYRSRIHAGRRSGTARFLWAPGRGRALRVNAPGMAGRFAGVFPGRVAWDRLVQLCPSRSCVRPRLATRREGWRSFPGLQELDSRGKLVLEVDWPSDVGIEGPLTEVAVVIGSWVVTVGEMVIRRTVRWELGGAHPGREGGRRVPTVLRCRLKKTPNQRRSAGGDGSDSAEVTVVCPGSDACDSKSLQGVRAESVGRAPLWFFRP